MSDQDRQTVAATLTALLLGLVTYWFLFATGGDLDIVDEFEAEHGKLLQGYPGCWEATRAEWLEEHPQCEFKGCRSKGPFEVHHIEPIGENPDRACDPTNLQTACREHHIWVSHQGLTRENNRNARSDFRNGRYPRMGWLRKGRHDRRKGIDSVQARHTEQPAEWSE